MNYIELINQFWRLRRKVRFTAHEADLYFYLLNEANELEWENPFQHATTLICANLGISRKTFVDLRNRLRQKGLIDFTEGQKNKLAATYMLLYVSKSTPQGNIQGNVKGNIQGNIDGNIQGNVLGNHSTKLNQTKLKEGDDDAAASPPKKKGEEGKASSAKPPKSKKPPSAAQPPKAEEDPVHKDFVDAYWQWYVQKVGEPPHLLESDYKALKKIRRYLTEAKKGDAAKALASWQHILNNWGKLEDFLQKQMRPAQIDSNMTNILAQLRTIHQTVTKNAGNQGNSSRQPAQHRESPEEFAARYGITIEGPVPAGG
ncbi:hypothetical protein CLV24_11436 [Pontibacter ummariensis]|uniref:Uncharacterized protein n=1 Tax=Pontibacter ummariensis TaxID=1610492 RepID=A0A239HKN2_9BACT|nr:hypothetical protein [Pontibacter ummariensis]PRY10308.1 hypothetical protein CLV24_11436 [Pontibacter ummariensis]SNS81907.1 hypothetical protein SAMN06296052_11436 [Pontibacter ummariensis]